MRPSASAVLVFAVCASCGWLTGADDLDVASPEKNGSPDAGMMIDAATHADASVGVVDAACRGEGCACSADRDCIDSLYRHCVDARCVECKSAPDETCTTGTYCRAARCVPGCSSDDACRVLG